MNVIPVVLAKELSVRTIRVNAINRAKPKQKACMPWVSSAVTSKKARWRSPATVYFASQDSKFVVGEIPKLCRGMW